MEILFSPYHLKPVLFTKKMEGKGRDYSCQVQKKKFEQNQQQPAASFSSCF